MRERNAAAADDTYGFGLLFEQATALDPSTLVTQLATSTPTELVSTSGSVIHLAHPDFIDANHEAGSTNIELSATPVEAADYNTALEQTWDWPAAEQLLAQCRYSLRVCGLPTPGLSYDLRYRLISTVAVAIVQLTNPTACHWEPADCLVEPKRLARKLQWPFNVRKVDFDRGRESLMDTLGLGALGLTDAQCYFRGLDPADMARWMYGLGRGLFTDGGVIAEGHSVAGLDSDQRWTCSYRSAMLPPERPVIDVKPPARYAGRHNIVAIVP